MKQHEIIKRFINVLVEGNTHSLMIVSPAGYGKTETTLNFLKEINLIEGKNFKYIPNYITPKGLVEELELVNELESPKLLILDDVEDTLRNINSVGVLKGALWATPDGRRKISWITSKETIKFYFTGKVIFLLNHFNSKGSIMNALKDRSMFYDIKLTNEELCELMIERSKVPYEQIPLQQREKIAEFLQKVGNGSKKLSLRLLPKAYQLYLVSPNHYQSLVLKMLDE